MGLVFELEESEFSGYIDEGEVYAATITNVRLREKPFKDERTGEPVKRVEFAFKLQADDSHDGQDIWGDTSTRFNDHPECVIEGTEVLPLGDLLGATKARYEGPVVRLVVGAGERLTVTMNHPVLTGRGWVPAHQVREGDQVLCQGFRDPAMAREDFDHVPAPVEQVFNALRSVAPHALVAATAAAFHGDGERVDGQVDVVGATGLLRYRIEPCSGEDREDSQFVARSGHGGLSESGGPPRLARGTDFHAPTGGMRLLDRDGVVAAVTSTDPTFAKTVEDCGPAAADLLADLRHGGARLVALDQVVDVEIQPWAGHVYNLHTTANAYFANGIVTHNCRLKNWSEAILGMHLPPHYRLDTDSLIDRRCRVVIGRKEWEKDGETKTRNFVREVHPTREAARALAASTTDEPF